MAAPRVRAYLKFIGANVHRLRVRKDLTQEAMSEATDLDVRFLRRVERGSVNLRFDTFVRLAEGLGVEPAALLRRAKPAAPKAGRPRSRRKTSMPTK
jgi:transcriptional regulator with XRE-family HTH domain